MPGVHQGSALPDRKSLFEASGDVAGKVFQGVATRRAVMMMDFLMVNFLALDEGDRFRVRGDFLDFRLLAAFQKALSVAHNRVVSKCFCGINGGKRSTGRGACRNGMAAGGGVGHSIFGLTRPQESLFQAHKGIVGVDAMRAGFNLE